MVLCLPGTFTAPQVFDACAGLVAADLVPLAWMDTPGPWDVGSLADWVVSRAAAVAGRAPVLLIGHSTGGVIALAAALREPSLFAGLAVVGTGANMHGHQDIDVLLERVRDHWDRSLADAVVARSYDRPLPADLQLVVERYAHTARREVVLQVLGSQHATDLEPALGALTMPVQVVHGRHDRARSIDHARALVRGLPDAELAVLDTGHTPMAEDPPAFARTLDRLLARAVGP